MRYSLCCAAKIIVQRRRQQKVLVCDACKKALPTSDKTTIRGMWKNPHTG